MHPDQITAVVVTRGNVPLDKVLEPLECFHETIVWDNSKRIDYGVYGRYRGISEAATDHVYVQDDDCVVPAAPELARLYTGTPIVSMSENRWGEYTDSALIGWGAIFPRTAPDRTFTRYKTEHRDWNAGTFNRCCDVIFTSQTEWTRVDLGHTDLPWAEGPDRMCWQPVHYPERKLVLEQCRALRKAAPIEEKTGRYHQWGAQSPDMDGWKCFWCGTFVSAAESRRSKISLLNEPTCTGPREEQ